MKENLKPLKKARKWIKIEFEIKTLTKNTNINGLFLGSKESSVLFQKQY